MEGEKKDKEEPKAKEKVTKERVKQLAQRDKDAEQEARR